MLINFCANIVHIIVPDNSKNPPSEYMGFPVTTIPGYPLIWYKAVTLSFGNKQIGEVIEKFKPDVIHVTTPGTLVFRTAYVARKFKIPLVMSYHTHLPAYAKRYFPVPGSVTLANNLVKWMHNIADLTLATSPELKRELENIGVKRVAVWEKGVNTQVIHFVSFNINNSIANIYHLRFFLPNFEAKKCEGYFRAEKINRQFYCTLDDWE